MRRDTVYMDYNPDPAKLLTGEITVQLVINSLSTSNKLGTGYVRVTNVMLHK